MKTAATILTVLGLASAANAGGTPLDGLSIGTITGGSSTSGDTSGSSDDMNAGSIGGGGSWSGGDDVYTLNWAGGDLVADLLFTTTAGDLDLFMFDAGAGFMTSSETTSDNEQISITGLAAGTYYFSIDGWFGATNSYKLALNGVPTPASAALLGLGGVVATRRRRA